MQLFFTQSLNIALKSLLATKARSFLTMLGIIIGVGSVILIMSIGAGAQSLILNQIETLGTNLLVVMPGASEKGSPPASVMGITITTLTYDDYLSIKDPIKVPNVTGIAIHSKNVGTASWKTASYDTNISGVNAGYQAVEGGVLAEGRFFTEEEERNLSRVVVLGSTVKKELFGDAYPIGQSIKIKKLNFEVIGVMEERGKVAFQDYDDQVLIPVRTVQRLISGVNHLGLMRIKINDGSNIDQAIIDITNVLRDNHDIRDQGGKADDFTITSGNDAMEMIVTITNSLKYFLAMMASLSLVVGGIGIMNIMLVSVTERTREIGLRKALGAKRANLLGQFLTEAVAVTLVGGLIGIIGGVLLAYLISVVAVYLGYKWDFVVTIGSIAAGVLVSVGVGLFFGIYPANKASKLDPIEALRHE
jgi:putative ABC transport system permease protein